MQNESEEHIQLRYPLTKQTVVGAYLFVLVLFCVVVFEYTPSVQYSIYESAPLRIFVMVFGSLLGFAGLIGITIRVINHDKYDLMIDELGFHGADGISFIPWAEIQSIEDKTIRYNALRQRVHLARIKVRSMRRILQNDDSYLARIRRARNIPYVYLSTVKRKDIQIFLLTLRQRFPEQIERYRIKFYNDVIE